MSVFNALHRDADGNLEPGQLVALGPVTSVEIHVPEPLARMLESRGRNVPAPAAGWALVDTGATRTAVDSAAIAALEVRPVGATTLLTAAGPAEQEMFPARIEFPAFGASIEFGSVTGVDLGDHSLPDGRKLICLIGRDVLSRAVMVYNGPGALWTIAF